MKLCRQSWMGFTLGVALCCSVSGAPIQLHDVTQGSGIRFVHTDGSSGKRHIVETVASGLALLDYDNDGDLDIYFLNGVPLTELSRSGSANVPRNALYRNHGDGVFSDVTAESGTGHAGYALGSAVADYDNDGDQDIFITNYGKHLLLRNNGNGTFTDHTDAAGLAEAAPGRDCVGAGSAFLDYDRDGHVDLYVGNYLRVDPENTSACKRGIIPVYCDPKRYPPAPDRLFRNQGDGTFIDVTQASGIGRKLGYTMGVVCSDFDGDGWADIFVGNDVQENFFFRNRRDGTFEEIGVLAGVGYDLYGEEQGTMGANAGDYDGDGHFDILITTYQNQLNTLYRNLGAADGILQFQDVTIATGAGSGSLPLVGWGCGLVDFDNDGRRELFIASGHLQDTVEQYDRSTSYKQPNQLLQWRNGRFVDIAKESGSAFQVVESSRGAVFGDLNNDGRMDVVVLNARVQPTVILNQTVSKHHWVILDLEGTRSNRSAVGAVARITAGGRTQVDEVRAGRGYQGADDLRLHFGLRESDVVERIQVNWPSGIVDNWTNVTADRVIRLKERSSLRPANHR